ncbi:hypothetical protein AC16_5232 [Escherichia coli 2-177-06_S3_C2]|nr:hypothetical protein AC16_5232 [Escherichia coli 2-177-06_S3_C2]KEO11009.1 hypothetical protein AC44_2387 [Escherichia coli 2-177-06_S3_C3]
MTLSFFITVIPGHDKPQPPGCLLGQNVLYEVNDEVSRVNILAVVGQRQNPRFII